jgi:LCP family protein required for cell wall assembly
MRGARLLARVVVLLAGVALVVPDSAVRPTTISLTTIGTAKAVDAGDGPLWVLVLGSEAAPGADVDGGLTDAIQLIGVASETRRAVAIGLPRDLWVDLPDGDSSRLNAVLKDEGRDQVATEVEELLGIAPDLVLVTGSEGFLSMMGSVGDVDVESPIGFTTDDGTVAVRKGTNTFDPRQALSYATTRDELPDGSDFLRAADHQRLLLGVLQRLRAAEDQEGYLEQVTLSALGGLDTNLSPAAAFRVIASLTTVDPARTAGCIVTGSFEEVGDALVVFPDLDQARAVGADARDDVRLQGGCRGGLTVR